MIFFPDKRRLKQNPSIQSQEVAFYAYMSKPVDNPGKQHTLIFDVTKTNAGNGYDALSGVFTAPLDGIYVFSCSITVIHSYASFNIVKNAEVQKCTRNIFRRRRRCQ